MSNIYTHSKGRATSKSLRKLTNEEIYLRELDTDFLEYDLYDIPYFKILRMYYYGGVKRQVWVPLSMPHRVIVEVNPPRQGYSHLTWNTINQYYLQRCMTKE